MLAFSRPAWLSSLVATVAVFAGCDNLIQPPGRGAQKMAESSSIRLPGASLNEARAAALAVLKERFRIDATASTTTSLVSRPLETTGRADQETAGIREILSGSSNRHRQIARIQLVEREPGVILALCTVQVQRLNVERSAFLQERLGEDRPGNLPANRVQEIETSEVDWSNVGRNRQLEREMLDEIADRLAPATAGAVPATRPQ